MLENDWISDRYQIIIVLGEGAMGAVYKCYDITLQKIVAIKRMHPHIAMRPGFRDRFLNEARTAARLDHPGIIQVLDVDVDKGLPFIVMKYVPGDNLENLLREIRKDKKWISIAYAVELVRQIALVLHHAHQNHILHRDIKPSNIMIESVPDQEPPYRVVLADLGLAKVLESDAAERSDWGGTPSYVSPEQARGEEIDGRADLYSLG